MDRDKFFQIGAIALACVTAWLALNIINAPPITRSEFIDWLQGLGTLAAVVVALWAAERPASAARRERLTAHRSFLSAIEAAAQSIRYWGEPLLNAIRLWDEGLLATSLQDIRIRRPQWPMEQLLGESMDKWPSAHTFVYGTAVVSGFNAATSGDPIRGAFVAPDDFWRPWEAKAEALAEAQRDLERMLVHFSKR